MHSLFRHSAGILNSIEKLFLSNGALETAMRRSWNNEKEDDQRWFKLWSFACEYGFTDLLDEIMKCMMKDWRRTNGWDAVFSPGTNAFHVVSWTSVFTLEPYCPF